jgi:hypothetical protein
MKAQDSSKNGAAGSKAPDRAVSIFKIQYFRQKRLPFIPVMGLV